MGYFEVQYRNSPTVRDEIKSLGTRFLSRAECSSFVEVTARELLEFTKPVRITATPLELTHGAYGLTGHDQAFIFPQQPDPLSIEFLLRIKEGAFSVIARTETEYLNKNLKERFQFIDRYVRLTKGKKPQQIADIYFDAHQAGTLSTEQFEYIRAHDLFTAPAWRDHKRQHGLTWQHDMIIAHSQLFRTLYYGIVLPAEGVLKGDRSVHIHSTETSLFKALKEKEIEALTTADSDHIITNVRSSVLERMCGEHFKRVAPAKFDL